MVLSKRGMPSRIVGNDVKEGFSIFLFLNGAGNVYSVHGNSVQSNFEILFE